MPVRAATTIKPGTGPGFCVIPEAVESTGQLLLVALDTVLAQLFPVSYTHLTLPTILLV